MWRQTAFAFVLSMTVPLGVAATVTHIEAVQASQRTAQAKEAQRLDRAASVSRWQAEALTEAAQDRDAAKTHAAELQQALDATTAERDAKQQEIDRLKALTAYSPGYGGGGAASAAASAGNRFPYGQCTWYVASRRSVPWLGNAWQWFGQAQAFGWATGATPRPAAIMVTWEGWGYGHVALVEQVNGNGSWVVSEMNFVAWGYVDRRTVWPGGTLVGFIY